METTTLREKPHSLIDSSPADRLKVVYHLLNDKEYSSYQKDGEIILKEEIDNMVRQPLHGKKIINVL
jgi:hypothetical protein